MLVLLFKVRKYPVSFKNNRQIEICLLIIKNIYLAIGNNYVRPMDICPVMDFVSSFHGSCRSHPVGKGIF